MVAPKPETAQLTDIDLCHLTPPSRSRSGSSSATHVRSGRASSTRCARTGLCSRSATRSRATSRRPSCRRSSRSPVALRFDGRRIPRRAGSATARARFRSRVSFPEPSQRARHLRGHGSPCGWRSDRIEGPSRQPTEPPNSWTDCESHCLSRFREAIATSRATSAGRTAIEQHWAFWLASIRHWAPVLLR